MNKFKKIIQEAPTTVSKNLQRSGDTTVQGQLPFVDGRSLRRVNHGSTKQFNLRLRNDLLERLYQRALIEKKSLTSLVETALELYLQ